MTFVSATQAKNCEDDIAFSDQRSIFHEDGKTRRNNNINYV